MVSNRGRHVGKWEWRRSNPRLVCSPVRLRNRRIGEEFRVGWLPQVRIRRRFRPWGQSRCSGLEFRVRPTVFHPERSNLGERGEGSGAQIGALTSAQGGAGGAQVGWEKDWGRRSANQRFPPLTKRTTSGLDKPRVTCSQEGISLATWGGGLSKQWIRRIR